MYSIEINKLEKQFGDLTAVNKIDLKINDGELFSLLGVNGAGKTTTIKMLSGLIKPTSGDATILGHSINKEIFEVKKIINVSPQETAVAPNLSVRENLEFIAGIYEMDNIEIRVNKIIKEFSLEKIEKKRADKLSGGWQRRLSIAMALITEPKVLFLDEPTLGLDVLARRELWKIIKSLKGKMTILLTTHYMEEAEELSDRVGIMSCGQLVKQGTPQELISSTNAKNFEDAFVKIAGGNK